jgi:hypothetical protein
MALLSQGIGGLPFLALYSDLLVCPPEQSLKIGSLDRPRSSECFGARWSRTWAVENNRVPERACWRPRASALLSVHVFMSLVRTRYSPLVLPPDLGHFLKALTRELEGKVAGAPAEAGAVGDAPAAPKRHEVGRVARRARPEIASHI